MPDARKPFRRARPLLVVAIPLLVLGYGVHRLWIRSDLWTSRGKVESLLVKRYGEAEGSLRLARHQARAERLSDVGRGLFWQNVLEEVDGTRERRVEEIAEAQRDAALEWMDVLEERNRNDVLLNLAAASLEKMTYGQAQKIFRASNKDSKPDVFDFRGRFHDRVLVTLWYPNPHWSSGRYREAPPLDEATPPENVYFDFTLTGVQDVRDAFRRLGVRAVSVERPGSWNPGSYVVLSGVERLKSARVLRGPLHKQLLSKGLAVSLSPASPSLVLRNVGGIGGPGPRR